MSWDVVQTKRFLRMYKKLNPNQLPEVNQAVETVASNPIIGVAKVGDLAALRVYKFSCLGQQLLLGYSLDKKIRLIYLESLGSHENFYRDLKN
jgi:mRNA interferase RelE/StbE